MPLDIDVLLLSDMSRSSLRFVQHRGELRRVEVPLVEETLRRLYDGGDDPGLRHDPAHRADGAAARAFCDPADFELEFRGACEGVAPLVHRRRAGVRGLPAKRHRVT